MTKPRPTKSTLRLQALRAELADIASSARPEGIKALMAADVQRAIDSAEWMAGQAVAS